MLAKCPEGSRAAANVPATNTKTSLTVDTRSGVVCTAAESVAETQAQNGPKDLVLTTPDLLHTAIVNTTAAQNNEALAHSRENQPQPDSAGKDTDMLLDTETRPGLEGNITNTVTETPAEDEIVEEDDVWSLLEQDQAAKALLDDPPPPQDGEENIDNVTDESQESLRTTDILCGKGAYQTARKKGLVGNDTFRTLVAVLAPHYHDIPVQARKRKSDFSRQVYEILTGHFKARFVKFVKKQEDVLDSEDTYLLESEEQARKKVPKAFQERKRRL
ncbi:MAG: hypothetical protein SGARI_006315 [Bacillariaceae sp.]